MSDQSKRDLIDSILNDTMVAGATGSDSYTITLDNSQYHASAISYNDTITITSGAGQSFFSGGGLGVSGSTYTIGTNSDFSSSFNWGNPEEWVDSFPDWQRVQDMCNKYPGLEIALRNFRTIYTLVKDDYDNPKDKE